MGLFIKKPFAALQAEANESGNKTLKRVLGPWSLIALGVDYLTVSERLKVTKMISKRGNSVPYELKPIDVQRRF